MSDTQVAETILSQLGGGRKLKLMTGAKDFFSIEKGTGLSFKVGNNPKKVTHVEIRLNGRDYYDVSFLNIRKTPIKLVEPDFKQEPFIRKVISQHADVDCERLMDLFEESTGLYLTFGRRS